MSIEKEILTYLNKPKKSLKYKGVRVGLLGLPDFKHYKYQTLANNCSLLKKKGYIKNINNGEYFITQKGKNFLIHLDGLFKKFTTKKTSKDPKDLLLMYDIPQDDTNKRNWLRRELIKFHFVMIQRSVWVGPSPLPDEFLVYVKELKLEDKLKTFKLASGYKISK